VKQVEIPPIKRISDPPPEPVGAEFYSPMPKADCLKCGGIGFVYANVPEGHPMRGRAVPCNAPGCYAERWRNRHTHKADLDAQFGRSFSLDSFKPRDASAKAMLAAATDLISGAIRWCLVYGGPGNGKTHWLRALEAEFRRRGRGVIYQDVADLLTDYWAVVKSDQGPDFIQRYKNYDVLILDDWKLEQVKDNQHGRLEEILSSRYNTAKTTIMATNNAFTELPERLRSRFLDKRISHVICNKGTDFRTGR